MRGVTHDSFSRGYVNRARRLLYMRKKERERVRQKIKQQREEKLPFNEPHLNIR
jgi:hypothetical protein